MKNNICEIVFILDRSGSMGGLESDTIGGFNSMLKKQKEENQNGVARLTTVLFDDKYELLHDRIDLDAVSPITSKEYFVRGSTALFDAIGKTVEKIVGVCKSSDAPHRPDKTIFIIITDGMENASVKYKYGRIKKLIERQKSQYGWEFIFLGANIDAKETADSIGIDRRYAQNFHADGAGLAHCFMGVSNLIVNARLGEAVSEDWDKEIEEDFESRGNKKSK